VLRFIGGLVTDILPVAALNDSAVVASFSAGLALRALTCFLDHLDLNSRLFSFSPAA